jgi:glycosyltransferase involved in cell wall biosynthesis
VRRAGVDGGRLVVVPHAVATDGVPVKDTAGGDLLFAGRLSPEKGVDVLLDALARVPGARLRIAGDGPQEAVLRRLADARAPGRVTFLGRLDRAAVHDEMRRSCAVVVPSQWHENQPITVLEAFACGVPVVATTLGGLPELVTDGVDGLLVVPGDARALGAALAAVAEDPERALAMGRAGRRKVAARFTPVRHLDALERTYARARRRSEVPA